MMVKVVFLDRETLSPDLELSHPANKVTWIEHRHTEPNEVVERLQGAQVAVLNKVVLSSDILAQLPSLRFVTVAATGYDCIDTHAARAHGITVSHVRGYATHTVPEHTFALILALSRSLIPYRSSVIAGRWQEANAFCYFDYPIFDLFGATLGIIGEGSLGQAVAKLGQAFGMKTLFAAHKGVTGLGPLYTPFDEVLARADVLTLHAPLTSNTQGLLGRAEFAKMERKPIVVNTARGGLIDEQSLLWALDNDLISGAGIDVQTPEPPPPDHPWSRIVDHPQVIFTPHVAWASREAQIEVWRQVIESIDAFLNGSPVRVVTMD